MEPYSPAIDPAEMKLDLHRVLPPLVGRLTAAVHPFAESNLLGITSHPEICGRVAYGVHTRLMPDGLVFAAILARSTEQAYVLFRNGERYFYFMDRIMNPWSADCGPRAVALLAEALAEWDAGAARVYISDGMRKDWPQHD